MAGNFSVRGFAVAAAVWILTALEIGAPVYGSSLVITPTFDTSITSDPNAAAIEGVINSAISIYEATFSNPIDVSIDFKEMTSGLGESTTNLFTVDYPTFYTAYTANATSNNNAVAREALADNVVPNSPDNPVNGASDIWVKTANLKALGLCIGCTGFDGTISLNTGITFPGSAGSSLTYSLMATAEHEIDEVLGLGSFLGSGLPTELPLPEDLFRFDALGNRTFTTSGGALAYFSINGTSDLAQFDNQNDGGDFGDWQSNPLPPGVPPKVQDAFATPGATAQLGVELIALQAVGYDMIVPEPASVYLFIVALPVFGLFARRRATQLTSMRAQPGSDAGSFS